MKVRVLLLALALCGCDSVPRDQVGTLARIAESRVARIGVVAGEPPVEAARLQALVQRSAAAVGARPQLVSGAAEPLLLMLEEGELDLVAGAFDRSSPWRRRVHLLPPLATRTVAGSEVETTAAARNGENGWVMVLEREARALASPR